MYYFLDKQECTYTYIYTHMPDTYQKHALLENNLFANIHTYPYLHRSTVAYHLTSKMR